MNDPHADAFARHARELYRRAGPQVDPAMAARLRAARREALAGAGHRRMPWMVPAGACAVAALALVALWQPLHGPATIATMAPTATVSADAAEALPPDADQTDPALYQNLDFYAWLAQQPAVSQAKVR